MARRKVLGNRMPNGQWRKKYRGQTKHISAKLSREEAERVAIAWMAEIDAADESAARDAEMLETAKRFAAKELERITAAVPVNAFQEYVARKSLLVAYHAANTHGAHAIRDDSELDLPSEFRTRALIRRILDEQIGETDKRPAPVGTIDDLRVKFLDHKYVCHTAGEFTLHRYDNYRRAVGAFCSWSPDDNGQTLGSMSRDVITGAIMFQYQTALKRMVGEKTISDYTARDRMEAAIQFVTYLADDLEVITMPKKMGSSRGRKAMTIKAKRKKPQPATIEECRTLLGTDNERVRLFVLLALNCGMTQIDISDMTNQDLKIVETGKRQKVYISRVRSKREKSDDGRKIKVSHLLWAETWELLSKHRNPDRSPDARILVTTGRGRGEAGTPLVWDKLDAKGNRQESDAIASAFKRVRTTLGVKCAFDRLRKTGGHLLRNNREHRPYSQLFLGQAPREVIDLHYAGDSESEDVDNVLDASVLWLRSKILGVK